MEEGMSIVIPAYSEAESLDLILPDIINSLGKINCKSEVLIIDTIEPTDNTKEICEKYKVNYIVRQNKNTYGDAIRTGIKQAKYSKIIIMDADGSHNSEDLIRLFNKFEEGFDIVIASRYIAGGNSYNCFILKFMSYCLNITFRLLFKLDIRDVSNSFRIYNAEKLKSLNLVCDNFDLVEEIIIKLRYIYDDIKITEIPSYFNRRLKGYSKRNLFKFILSYFSTIKRLQRLKNEVQNEKSN